MKPWITFTFIAGTILVHQSAWGNSSPPIKIVTTAEPPARWTVDFDDVRTRIAKVHVADRTSGDVEVYPLSTSPGDRRRKSCTYTLTSTSIAAGTVGELDLFKPKAATDACKALIEPLMQNEATELAISVPGTAELGTIAYEPPKAYQGKEAKIEIIDNGDGVPVWSNTTLKLPDHVALSANTTCYLLLDDWHTATCVKGPAPLQLSVLIKDVIAARWARKDPVHLIINAIDAESSTGAWRSVPMVLTPNKKDDDTPATDKDALDVRCKKTAEHVEITDYYLLCVDAFEDRTGSVAMHCRDKKPESCKRVGDLFESGKSYVVRIWRAPKVQELAVLSGAAGYTHLYDPLKKAGDVSDEKIQLWYFDSRKAGDITLTVTIWRFLKADEPPKEIVKLTFPYRVRGKYRVVGRLGLGLTWAPDARKLGVYTTPDNQKYVTVAEGGDGGLFNNEIVVGLTFFPWPMLEDSVDLKPAFGLRLGLVSVGSDNKWFRSLMVGPELTLGPDLSIGIFGGIVQHDRPKDGYEPGMLLPVGVNEVPTSFGVAPAVGLALNFTPGFLKAFGVDR